MTKKASVLAPMLKDKSVEKWYKNLARGAQTTANGYVRRLKLFCDTMDITPKNLVKKTEDEIFDMLLDFVEKEEKREVAGSYIDGSLKGVKSWLSHNNIQITRKIRIKNATKTPTIENERVPTQEELRKIRSAIRRKISRLRIL